LEMTALAPKPILAVETESRAVEIHRAFGFEKWPCSWSGRLPSKLEPGTLGVFSYSLLEERSVVDALTAFDHLLIVTPSTREEGRRLLEIRRSLSAKGFFSWAPCTHSLDCPLLVNSKTDWCHDRIAFESPEWFKRLESHLPNYNHTLTYSYW